MTAKQTNKLGLTQDQFRVVANLIRAREPARTAAHMILVEGKSNGEAAEATGLTPQSVSNTLTRYRATHSEIMGAYNAQYSSLNASNNGRSKK